MLFFFNVTAAEGCRSRTDFKIFKSNAIFLPIHTKGSSRKKKKTTKARLCFASELKNKVWTKNTQPSLQPKLK